MATRRDFLKTAVGSAISCAAASMSVDTLAAAPSAEWRNRQSDMAYRRLGRTGFMVSEIVMGGNEIRPDNYEHIFMALEMGCNYLDTSPAYGNGLSEEALSRVIKSRPRNQFFLTSKVSLWDDNRNAQFRDIFDSLSESEQDGLRRTATEEIERRGAADPDYLVNYFASQKGELEATTLSNVMEKKFGHRIDREKNYKRLILDSVEGSLKRLQTDHLDIVMCPHGASSSEEVTAYPEIFDAFEVLRKAGKVRHLGVSSHSDPAGVLAAATQSGMHSMAMVAYNVANHRFLDKALADTRGKDVGVIAMKVARAVHPGPNRGAADPTRLSALNEQVRGDWKVPQKAYLWGLKNQDLSAIISNMVNAAQVKQNLPLPLAAKA